MRIISLIVLVFLYSVSASAAADFYCFTDGEGNAYYTNVPGNGRVKVLLPIKKSITKPSSSSSLNRKAYESIITSASQRFAVDADLVRAVIKAESNFDYRAVSPKGALGLMQLMPATAREMAVINPFDPEENIHAGVRYLGELLQLLNRDLPMALAAYNAAPQFWLCYHKAGAKACHFRERKACPKTSTEIGKTASSRGRGGKREDNPPRVCEPPGI
ncbi:MAG: lytic transglycosylase domain-containing protein [Thermodesulfobacteriota bacterium]